MSIPTLAEVHASLETWDRDAVAWSIVEATLDAF